MKNHHYGPWVQRLLTAAALMIIAAGIPAQSETAGAGKGGIMEGTTIQLPEANFRGMTLEEALEQRRSVRRYGGRPITTAQLSQLLFAGQGMSGRIHGRTLRTAPSAGATYPMELYAAVNKVAGLEPGIYRYVPGSHSITLIKKGHFGAELRNASLGQEWLETAGAVMIITAVPERILRYGERADRYMNLEAGHIAQNILLEVVSLGLAAVPIGAYRDREVAGIMSLDEGTEQVVYMVTVGTR